MAKNINLKSIDLKNLPYQSRTVQLIMGAIVIVFILLLAYIFIFSDTNEKINDLKKEEETLKQSYIEKSATAANLDKLKLELNQINRLFQVLLKQLPTSAEIPNLIQELNENAGKNGLTMESITPSQVIQTQSSNKDGIGQQLIETLPYHITLRGNYDQITQFVRDIGKLSRIVTINSIVLKKNGNNNDFTFTAVANTYKALSDNEIKALTENKGKK
ncbi:Tfp pilus assembly protein PilO [Snodgrassella alvi SCGC AB-598-O02]|nr:type 4a pilus biogenesis protein PilO [Snodgrassella alvi]KES11039.1 Tfp pilus assembly protein PilO [Snodgrassella alvi SCGC AB-598-O02]